MSRMPEMNEPKEEVVDDDVNSIEGEDFDEDYDDDFEDDDDDETYDDEDN